MVCYSEDATIIPETKDDLRGSSQIRQYRKKPKHLTGGTNPVKQQNGQVNKAVVISDYLRDVIWNYKIKIYKICVKPIMRYGMDTRLDTTRSKSLLGTA